MWLLATVSSATVVAATSTGGGWETYGPLGILSAMGLAFFSKAYKREADRGDRLEAELRQVSPRLLQVAELLPRVLQALERLEAEALRRNR